MFSEKKQFQKPASDTSLNATAHVLSNSSSNYYYCEFLQKTPRNEKLSDIYDHLKTRSSDTGWHLDPIHRQTHNINSLTKLRSQNVTDHYLR